MKAKIESIHYLGVIIIAGLILFANEGKASQVLANDTAGATGTLGTTDTSGTTSTTTAAEGTTATGVPGDRPKPRGNSKSKNIFYMGVCTGQVLAKQGTYLSDIASGATTATAADLKAAIKAAIVTCKAEAKARRDASGTGTTTTATPTPTATPTSTAATTSITTTSAQ